MNQSKAKFFRKYCRVLDLPYRGLKRYWAAVPRARRGDLFTLMMQTLNGELAKPSRRGKGS